MISLQDALRGLNDEFSEEMVGREDDYQAIDVIEGALNNMPFDQASIILHYLSSRLMERHDVMAPEESNALLGAGRYGPVPLANPFGDEPGPYDPDWEAQDEAYSMAVDEPNGWMESRFF